MTDTVIIIVFILVFLAVIIFVIKRNNEIEKKSASLGLVSSSLGYKNVKQEGKTTVQDVDNAIGQIGKFVGALTKK